MRDIKDQLQSFIQDLIRKNQDILMPDDFKECREAVSDVGEMIQKLEATEVKFRRKLTDISARHPTDKEKIIYLQGLVDGIGLAIKPWKSIMVQPGREPESLI
ncbi:hypothetical protein [Paenibacillus agricola]|uniref:Uncharacterized protein n=1 Tax=Paenibacillus agricola TaxID=2716264 RepID=A0ABX0JAT1_9BACL|nr:hypothetical protein [Paenibacillus agricola]NHN32871.1 hypothetical protein [Paenibacillus agricola]